MKSTVKRALWARTLKATVQRQRLPKAPQPQAVFDVGAFRPEMFLATTSVIVSMDFSGERDFTAMFLVDESSAEFHHPGWSNVTSVPGTCDCVLDFQRQMAQFLGVTPSLLTFEGLT